MSDNPPAEKKMSLREKMALKKSQGSTIEAFVPTAPQEFTPTQSTEGSSLTSQLGFQGYPAYQAPAGAAWLTQTQLTPELFQQLCQLMNMSPQFVYDLANANPQLYQQFYEQVQVMHQQSPQRPQEIYEEPQEEEYQEPEIYEEPQQQYTGGLGDRQTNQKGGKKKGPAGNQNQNKNQGGNKGQANNAQKKPAMPAPKKAPEPPKEKKYVEEIIDIAKIQEKEKNAEKHLDLTKEPMNIIFIGHVDSGKSTMCGTILMLAGKVDKEEFRRYEAEAKEKGRLNWLQAYIMDINEEERDKGITVEIGKAMFELKKKRFTIIDCPGHKNYVPNMISGASQADIAALVISAKSGEFEAGFDKGGQTREHAILAAYLGSSHLVIIINKMDDNNWDIKRFNHIKDTMTPFLKDICEMDVEKQVTWVPVSAMQRINITEKVPADVCSWYKGESLLDTLDNIPKKERVHRDCLRMPVSDKHSDKGDLILYGKIESGSIKEGMKLMLMPSKKEITCVKILDNEDRSLAVATTGDNIKVYIKGVEPEEVRKGFVVCGLQYLCHTAYEFEAELTVMDPPANKVISNGFPAVLHLHAIQEEIEIVSVKTNKNLKKTGGLLCLKQGDTGKVIIKSINDSIPLCLEKFSEFPELARFTLRAESSTIAVGKVLRVKSLNRGPGQEYIDYYMHKKLLAEQGQTQAAPQN